MWHLPWGAQVGRYAGIGFPALHYRTLQSGVNPVCAVANTGAWLADSTEAKAAREAFALKRKKKAATRG